MKKTVTKSILCSILFILIGVGLIIFGINNINDYKDKKQSYVEISAKVVDYDYSGMRDEGAYTVYEYEVNGVVYRAKSNVKSTNLPSMGKVKTIMYNPSDPTDVIFLGGSNYIFLIVGGVFSVAGLLLLYRDIYLKKSSNNIKYDNTDINNVVGPNNN